MNIGVRIKRIRKGAALTQGAFGEIVGLKTSSISCIEKGECNPSKAVIKVIAQEFSINEEWLREGCGEMRKDGADQTVGERIKRLRAGKDISQAALAEALDVSSGNVGDWERGKAKPGADALIRLSNYFGTTTDWILTGIGNMHTEPEHQDEEAVQPEKYEGEMPCTRCFYLAYGKKAALLEERILRIETIAGKSMEELDELLLKGYTLRPPEPADMKQLERQIKERRRKSLWKKLLTSFEGVGP